MVVENSKTKSPDLTLSIPSSIEGWPVPNWVGPSKSGISQPAHLEIHKDGALFDTFDFKGRPIISVGRAADRVIFTLDHPSISRFHAVFLHHRHLEASCVVPYSDRCLKNGF